MAWYYCDRCEKIIVSWKGRPFDCCGRKLSDDEKEELRVKRKTRYFLKNGKEIIRIPPKVIGSRWKVK